MPLTFLVHAESGYFESRWVGPISEEEMFRSYEEFTNLGTWIGLSELANLSEADLSSLSVGAVGRLAAWAAQLCERHGATDMATAVYAPHNLSFGLARMYEAMADASPEHVQVFRDRAEAIAWLTEHRANRRVEPPQDD